MGVGDLVFGARSVWASAQLRGEEEPAESSWWVRLRECYARGDHVAALQLIMALNDETLHAQVPEPALHQAAAGGDLRSFDLALKRGCDPHGMDYLGRSPGHPACEHGHLAILTAWRTAGGNLAAVDQSGNSLAHAACRGCQPLVVNWLIGRGAPVSARNAAGKSTLHLAIEGRFHAQLIRALCDSGADVTEVDHDGNTPLHLSVALGLPATAIALLEHLADPSAVNCSGRTPDVVAPISNESLDGYNLASAMVARQRWSQLLIAHSHP